VRIRILAKYYIFKTEDNVPVNGYKKKKMGNVFSSLKSLKKEVGSISQRHGSAPKSHGSATLFQTVSEYLDLECRIIAKDRLK
jgi:hypothetical protein